MSVQSIQPVQPLDIATPVTLSGNTSVSSFAEMLHSAYSRVESSDGEAARAIGGFVDGDRQDLHSVALAVQKASLEFEMMLQVRNKVVQAYQEVMRMQL